MKIDVMGYIAVIVTVFLVLFVIAGLHSHWFVK